MCKGVMKLLFMVLANYLEKKTYDQYLFVDKYKNYLKIKIKL
jgi:hypothetical protein